MLIEYALRLSSRRCRLPPLAMVNSAPWPRFSDCSRGGSPGHTSSFSTEQHRLNQRDQYPEYLERGHHFDPNNTKEGFSQLNIEDDRKQQQQQQRSVVLTNLDDVTLSMNEPPRTSVLMELTDRVGVLHDVLRYFWKHDISISRIESRPAQVGRWGRKRFDFFVDFYGSRSDPNVEKLLSAFDFLTQESDDRGFKVPVKKVPAFYKNANDRCFVHDKQLS